MCQDGEEDLRAVYIFVLICKLLKIEGLCDGMAEYIASCQSYEGGLGAVPGAEAHGGYTFCGFAALCLLERTEVLDKHALIKWVSDR